MYYKWTIAVSSFSSLCLWYFVAAINSLTGNLNEYILYNNCPTWLAAVSFEGMVIHWFIFSWYCMKTILLYSLFCFVSRWANFFVKTSSIPLRRWLGGSSVLEWKKGLLLKCEGFFNQTLQKWESWWKGDECGLSTFKNETLGESLLYALNLTICGCLNPSYTSAYGLNAGKHKRYWTEKRINQSDIVLSKQCGSSFHRLNTCLPASCFTQSPPFFPLLLVLIFQGIYN